MKRVLVAASLAAVALSAAACGSDSSSSSQGASAQTTLETAAATTTETTEKTTEKTTETTGATTEATTQTTAQTETDETTTAQAADSALGVPAWVESPSTVGGVCGTTPEGATAKAAQATSCGFAGVMYEQAKQLTFTLKQGSSGNSLYRTGDFTVASPTTQENYTIECRIGSDLSTITCEDPSDRSRGAYFNLDTHNWPDFVTTSEG